jgi:hypothetical protein
MKIRILILSLLMIAPSIFGGVLLAQDDSSSGMPEETDLIICNKELGTDGKFTNPCDFNDFVDLGKRVINFMIYLAVPLAALTFAYSGFTILTAGGNTGQRDKGKKMFGKVAMGLFWILAAWLIINTILNALLKDGYSLLE